MAVYQVTNSSDSGAGSLRQAVSNANSNPGADSIQFDSGISAITLTSGQLSPTGQLSIIGLGDNILSISGNNSSRIFNIVSGATVTISDLTIAQGSVATSASGGGVSNSGTLTLNNIILRNNSGGNSGGGIANNGTLTLSNSSIYSNLAQFGGGVNNSGTLNISNSSIYSNLATAGSGGGVNSGGGTLNLTNSSIYSNSASSTGGGVANTFSSIANITDSAINNNTTSSNGGGIQSSGAAQLTITNTTINNNSATAGSGGGVQNNGTLTLTTSSINSNSASSGGGVNNTNTSGNVNLTNNTINSNSASSGGGVNNSGTLNLTNNTLSNNLASSQGGGVFNSNTSGNVNLTNNTLSNNSASSQGGGVYNNGILNLTNSTLSSNSASSAGGGVYNNTSRTITLINNTISGNSATAGNGGGLRNLGTTNLANNIIANSLNGGDVKNTSTINPTAPNLVEDGTLSGAITGDPSLGALQNNGGTTSTHALLSGSIAIDKGNSTLLPADSRDLDGDSNTTEPLPIDQRGYTRVIGSQVDLGAVEARNISIAPVTVTEGNAGSTLAKFIVTLSTDSNTQTTVEYSTADGSATTASGDYLSTAGVLTFAPTESLKTISVGVSGDTVKESDETFTVNLTNVVGLDVILATTSATGTITDDEPKEISISAVTVTEGNTGSTLAKFIVTLSNPSTSQTTVEYSTTDVSATTADSDYLSTAGVLTFAPTETLKTISVAVSGDTAYENDETFTVNLTNAVGNNVTITTSSATGTITNDDEPPSLVFSSATYTVNEDGTPVSAITVTRSGDINPVVSAVVTPIAGTAALADFTSRGLEVSFAAGETSQTVIIPITDDNRFEGDENLNLVLSSPQGGAILGTLTSSTLTILDNDTQPTLAFSSTDYTVSEGTTTASVVITRTGATDNQVGVRFITTNNTATSPADYAGTTSTVSFTSGQTTKTVSVNIVNDNRFETSETVNLALSSPTGSATLGSNTAATLTLTDNDTQPTLAFNSTDYTVSEGATTASVVITRTGATENAVSVTYETTTGTATPGTDYTATTGTLSFSSGQTSKTVTVNVIDDNLFEGNETLSLSLSAPTPSSEATLGTQTTATLTIQDNDIIPSIAFSSADYSVTEGNTTATVVITRTNATGNPVSATFATTQGTATSGLDYNNTTTTVSFSAGETSKTVSVSILDDNFYEGNELVNLSLSNPSSEASLGTLTSSTLTIQDNEPQPIIAFSDATYTVDENGITDKSITLTRTGTTTNPVSVVFTPTSSSATLGADLNANTITVSFAAGVTSRVLQLGIIDDDLFEGDETINLALSSPTGRAALGSLSAATLTIQDNDPQPEIAFSTSNYSVNENGSVVNAITITVSGARANPVGVLVTPSNGNAMAPNDYSNSLIAVSFASGVTVQTITIPVVDDTLIEVNETVNLTLSNPTGGAVLGTQSTASLAIVNNDFPTAGIDTVESSVTYSISTDSTVENVILTGTGNINAIGNTQDNQLTGNSANNYLSGGSGNDTLNALGGQDTLAGGIGNDVYVFGFGESVIAGRDRIADFSINNDKIDLLTNSGGAVATPVAFSRATDSTAPGLSAMVNQVFADSNGQLSGAQPLGINSAALVVATPANIAGTYLIVNNNVNGFQSGDDSLINITEYNGTLPALGAINPTAFFV